MSTTPVPAEIMALAEERRSARAAHDWPRADALKARIEAAGWKVVDEGPTFSLSPAHASDQVVDGRTLYGSAASVPSALDGAPTAPATVAVLDPAGQTSLTQTLEAVAAHRPEGVQVLALVVGDASVGTTVPEVVRTVEPFTAGDALEAVLRRTRGEVVVVLEPALRPTADVVTPLVEALRDPGVAIAGRDGLLSTDLHHFEPASGPWPTAIAAGCYAFRREDAVARGPIDGRLRLARSAAIWLSLLLRDEGNDREPRRALVVELPLAEAAAAAVAAEDPAAADLRAARRDGYLVAGRFGDRERLRAEEPPQRRVVGDGAQDHDRTDHAEQDRDPQQA